MTALAWLGAVCLYVGARLSHRPGQPIRPVAWALLALGLTAWELLAVAWVLAKIVL